MLKYLWTGIICTPHFLNGLQKRLAFIDMNRDHSQSGISEWKKKKKVYLLVSPYVNNVWTLLCEHPSVNCFFKSIVACMSMHKASLSKSTNVWTLLCEHPSVNCFFKSIVACMSMHKASLSKSTSTTLPLAYHHASTSVNNVWTLLCEHPSVNYFFTCIVPCMSMHKASLSTSTSTTLPFIFTNVWTGVNHVLPLGCVLKNMCQLLL